jgi:multidrug efflux system membrane fusion protein
MPEHPYLPSWARPDKKKPGRMTTVIGIAVVIVVTILIAVGLTLFNGHATPPAGGGGGGGGGFGGGFGGGRRQPITVGTAKAVVGQIPITLDALGTVTPPVTAVITSRIAGNLTAVNFTEGQMVKKGQVLAQIDPRPYRVALEQAQGTLAHDQALLADAQLDLKRYQTLLAQSSIASQQVDTQAALVKQDQGLVISDQAAVDNAKLNLAYTTITAPVNGRVGLRQVDVGNYVPAGSTTGLVVLTQIDPMDVEFAVPEDNIPLIAQRQHRGATLIATALNRDAGEQLAVGALSTLDTQIDPTTGTVKAKARFDNKDMNLFPQQFVNIHLLIDTLCNQVVVPTTAVRHGAQGDYVFTVQPDKTAKVQYVKTGPGTAETVSVSSGVSPGDVVITDGGDRLRDGSPVLLPGDTPPAAQPAQTKGGQSGQHRFGGRGRGGSGGFGHGHRGQGMGGAGGQAAPAGPPVAPGALQQARDLANASCDGPQNGQGPNSGGHFGGHGHHGQFPGAGGPDGAPPSDGSTPNGQSSAGPGGGHFHHRRGQVQDQEQGAPPSDGSAG